MAYYITVDTENTTSNIGHPLDTRNRNVCISIGDPQKNEWLATRDPKEAQIYLNRATDLVGFNIKYDLHWLSNLGLDFRAKRIWDTQIGVHLLSYQQHRMPSLSESAEKYNLGKKIDHVKKLYWEKGIDTDAIPWDVLSEYAIQDVWLTWHLYEQVSKEIAKNPNLQNLWMLEGYDAVVLMTMERNGLEVDFEYQNRTKQELEEKRTTLGDELKALAPDLPVFNPSSGEHLSALLYGGVISYVKKIPNGIYKSGKRAGQVKFSSEHTEYVFPRKTNPLRGSELLKAGVFRTDEKTLKKLRGVDKIRDKILEYKGIDVLISRYFEYAKKIEELSPADRRLHTNFSQVTTNTGRIASNNPNIQNTPAIVDKSFITRFA